MVWQLSPHFFLTVKKGHVNKGVSFCLGGYNNPTPYKHLQITWQSAIWFLANIFSRFCVKINRFNEWYFMMYLGSVTVSEMKWYSSL